jgi:hypothetical protein
MPVNLKKDDMGDVVTDFYKSDAPQFKGKSKKKRRQMAIAAKLNAEESTEIHDADGNLYATVIDIIKPVTMKVPEPCVRWQELTEKKESNIIEEKTYNQWTKAASDAVERIKKSKLEKQKKTTDATYRDTRDHGIKFSDKKGSGRIVKGKKVYT